MIYVGTHVICLTVELLLYYNKLKKKSRPGLSTVRQPIYARECTVRIYVHICVWALPDQLTSYYVHRRPSHGVRVCTYAHRIAVHMPEP